MRNQLTEISLALRDFVEPLRRRLTGPEALEYLFYRYGWNSSLDGAAFDRIQQVVSFIAPLEQFVASAEQLRQQLDANPDAGLGAADAAALAQAGAAIVRALADFHVSDLTGLPDPLARADFWESIGEHVLDDLLEDYLRTFHPGIYLVLRLWKVIRYDLNAPAGPGRRPYSRVTFDWTQAQAMLGDPVQALGKAYHWNEPAHPFEHQQALAALQSLFDALHVPAKLFAPAMEAKAPFAPEPGRAIRDDQRALRATLLERYSPADKTLYRLGLEVFPAARTGEAKPTGLMARPILQGGASASIPLSERVAFDFSAAASLASSVGFAMFPGKADLVGGAPAVGTSAQLATDGKQPLYLLGNARSSRIELSGLSAKLSFEGSLDDPEIKLRLACAGATGPAGAKVVIQLGDADSILSRTIGRSSLEFSFAPELIWSSKTGLSFNGQPRLELDLPLAIGLGPVSLTGARVALGPGPRTAAGTGVSCQVGVGLVGKLGPVALVVDRIGFECVVTPYRRADVRALPAGADAPALGTLDVDLGFLPPNGIGLSVDAGAVKGGGFLRFDAATHRYSGALQLAVAERFTLTGIGMMEPTASGKTSTLLLATLELPPANPSFSVTGVGALVALHRAGAAGEMMKALQSGDLDAVLFPADPIARAGQIIATLGRFFPATDNVHLIGILLQFVFGGETRLITGELGVLLQLGSGAGTHVYLLLQGKLELPGPAKKAFRINVEGFGDWDVGRGEFMLRLALRDSKIFGADLSGEGLIRYYHVEGTAGGRKQLFISLGGYHPSYRPPAGAEVGQRLALTVKKGDWLKFEVSQYVALTPGAYHFGADASLLVKFEPLEIRGELGYDALIGFDWSFNIGIHASMLVKFHGYDICGVSVEMNLIGPGPTIIKGKVSVSVLWWDISKSFCKELSSEQAPLPPPPDVAGLLRAAVQRPESWLDSSVDGISLAKRNRPATTVWASPTRPLRMAQKVVPLGLTIDRYGAARLSERRSFTIDSVRVGNDRYSSPKPVYGEFGRALYLELSEQEKLAADGFDELVAGFEVGGDAIACGPAADSTADYEEIVVAATARPAQAAKTLRPVGPALLAQAARLAPAAAAPARKPRVALKPARFAVAGQAEAVPYAVAREQAQAARQPGTPAPRVVRADETAALATSSRSNS